MDDGKPCALVSVLAVEGSAPREAGTRMVVTADALFGTIGGGHLEYLAVRQARAALAHPPGAWRIQDYPLGPLLGQCCGGRVRVMVERLDPVHCDWLSEAAVRPAFVMETRLFGDHAERRLVDRNASAMAAKGEPPVAGDCLVEAVGEVVTPLTLFGAGHVGQAIARLMPGLPFDLSWYDSRPEYGMARVVSVDRMVEAAEAAEGAVLIMTHDHALDYRLTAAALLGPAGFVGLIGSATKRARFVGRLRRDGLGDAVLARLTCPVGVAEIVGKAPEVIAVAVAAQLLVLRGTISATRLYRNHGTTRTLA
ncbi:MAG: xanthine dehydrogenase accessory protein XdhC [Asticcacaulis sp.]|nr:xanthine dehydrogenase accessory protein XdhC [Asticcacaulis sp.]